MTLLKHTLKTDTLFKILFVKHPNLLKRLISVLLTIRLEDISQFEITNTETPPEAPTYFVPMGEKLFRVTGIRRELRPIAAGNPHQHRQFPDVRL